MFIPDNGEFLTLYVIYLVVFLILLIGTIKSKSYKEDFTKNLIFFLAYLGIMIYISFNENNFKGGNSLGVLFIGGIFILLHLLIFISKRIYLIIANRSKRIDNL